MARIDKIIIKEFENLSIEQKKDLNEKVMQSTHSIKAFMKNLGKYVSDEDFSTAIGICNDYEIKPKTLAEYLEAGYNLYQAEDMIRLQHRVSGDAKFYIRKPILNSELGIEEFDEEDKDFPRYNAVNLEDTVSHDIIRWLDEFTCSNHNPDMIEFYINKITEESGNYGIAIILNRMKECSEMNNTALFYETLAWALKNKTLALDLNQ